MEAVLIVVPDADRTQALLVAIKEAGAPGATVFETRGMEFLSWLSHPAMALHWGLEGMDRAASQSILAVVPDDLVEAVVEAAERALGGFSQPNSGMLCTWPVSRFRCYRGDKPSLKGNERQP